MEQFIRKHTVLSHNVSALEASELEPEERVGPQREHVRQFSDAWKQASPEHLDGKSTRQRLQVELDRLRATRQVVDAEHLLLTKRSQVRQHPMIRRFQERRLAAAEDQRRLTHGNQLAHPVQEGMVRAFL